MYTEKLLPLVRFSMDESGIEATQALDLGDYDDEDVTDDELSDSTPVSFSHHPLNIILMESNRKKMTIGIDARINP